MPPIASPMCRHIRFRVLVIVYFSGFQDRLFAISSIKSYTLIYVLLQPILACVSLFICSAVSLIIQIS